MYQSLPRDGSFWKFLFDADRDLAETARQKGCPCGGRLHCAHYLRQPRGSPDKLRKEHCYMLSFCCNREGCRKRVTPPSVRFLGRKVYLAAAVVLVAAMEQGPSPRRVRELSKLFEIDRRTIVRWRIFWRDHFPRTPFWKVARGRFRQAADLILPRSLMEAFVRNDDDQEGWKQLLIFLSPITTTKGLAIEVSG